MTVICWDGKTLAADRMCQHGHTASPVVKIFRVRDELVGVSGCFPDGMELLDWFRAGAVPKDFPSASRSREGGAALLVIGADGRARKYEIGPYPFFFDSTQVAAGCGDESALVAMACGKNAREAVEMAIRFNSGCGLGVDTLELNP
jgi:20S proteasome alpha/beta subunit